MNYELLKENMSKVYVRQCSWERIYLKLVLTVDDMSAETEFFLVKKHSDSELVIEAKFDIKSHQADTYEIVLNITNTGINRCVEDGTYFIVAISKAGVGGVAICDISADALKAYNREFSYWSNKGIYQVTFNKQAGTEGDELTITFCDKKLQSTNEAVSKSIFSKCRLFAARIKHSRKIERFLYRFYRIFYKNNSKNVLILSEQSDTLAFNFKALVKKIDERKLNKRLIYSLRKKTSEKYSRFSDFSMIKKVAKCNTIIVDDHIPLFDYLELDSKVKLIQIWHAGAGFKGVGYSRWGHSGCPGPVCCHRQYTYCIAGSSKISHFFSEQFGILDEQVIPTGMPRVDEFLDEKYIEATKAKLYELYPEWRGSKIVLFAPTYRGDDRKTAYYPYENIDFKGIYDYAVENDAFILFKMHPWVSKAVPIQEEYKDRLMDLNSYGNINDLFYITDLLITDYSSSQYEFLLMNKPMLFYAFDKEEYSVSRGFHREYDSNVPGKICTSFEELLDAMKKQDYEAEKLDSFRTENFDSVDCGNSDRVIDWLILDELPEKYINRLQAKKKMVNEFYHKIIKVK